MYRLYTVSGAPRPWRALLGLTFKDLDYELHFLEASRREHKQRPFLDLNPRGTIPVLTDGEVTLCDSIAILAWLDRRHPEKPLFGDNPTESAAIWQRTTDIAEYLRAATNALLGPVFGGATGTALDDLKPAAQQMNAELRRLETLLASRPFLSGAGPTAADAVAFPEVRLMQRAADTKRETMAVLGFGELAAIYPNLVAWVARIEALPGFERTMPPHWQSAA